MRDFDWLYCAVNHDIMKPLQVWISYKRLVNYGMSLPCKLRMLNPSQTKCYTLPLIRKVLPLCVCLPLVLSGQGGRELAPRDRLHKEKRKKEEAPFSHSITRLISLVVWLGPKVTLL